MDRNQQDVATIIAVQNSSSSSFIWTKLRYMRRMQFYSAIFTGTYTIDEIDYSFGPNVTKIRRKFVNQLDTIL